MNPAHIHLILNTIPGIGIALAIAAMLYGMARRSAEVIRFGFLVMIGVALITIAVFLSGKRAINVIGNLPGVILPNVEAHERAGRDALIAVEIAGGVSLIVLVAFGRGAAVRNRWVGVVLAAAIVTFAVVIRAATLGGHIHHPETGGNQVVIELPKVDAPLP